MSHDDQSPSGPRVGLGGSFSDLAPVKPAHYEHSKEEANQLREALAQPERQPDAIDVFLQHGNALDKAMNTITPQRVRERDERLRREAEFVGRHQAQAAARYEVEQDEAAISAQEQALREWLDED